MKWANRKSQIKMILAASAYGLVAVAILYLWTISITVVPQDLEPQPLNIGELILKEYPNFPDSTNLSLKQIIPIDSTITQNKYEHVLDALHMNRLKKNDYLVRIFASTTKNYWDELIIGLLKQKICVFWQEAMAEKKYREVYLGPFSSEKDLEQFISSLKPNITDSKLQSVSVFLIKDYDTEKQMVNYDYLRNIELN